MPEELMLTTIDNPYNPFTHFDEWYAFDEHKGYHTCSLLARITVSSDELSEAEVIHAQNEAIKSIVRLNPLGIYKKVKHDDVIEVKKE